MVLPATKVELLEVMRAERAQWEALLAEVGEARMTQPGVEGEWSVKDVVAHVLFYERWTAEQMDAARRGDPPPTPAELERMDREGWLEQQSRNALVYEQMRHLPLAEVLTESQRTFQQLLAAVEATSEEQLDQPHWWTNGASFRQVIPGECHEHYRNHSRSIRAWLDRQPA